jgi:crossover junction endodeoxyribonuclease RuvC
MKLPREAVMNEHVGERSGPTTRARGSGDSSSLDRVVLGIDPGTATMGYGVVGRDGDRLVLLDYGGLTTPANLPLYLRLQALYRELMALIATYRPSEVAVEELFFSRNTKSALAVGQARGVAILAAANAGATVSEYTPLEVKQAIAGYGRATKEQIQQMVCMLLDLAEVPQPDDAADALAIAICHLHTSEKARIIEEWTEE